MKIIKAKITKDSTLVATYKDENGTTTVEGIEPGNIRPYQCVQQAESPRRFAYRTERSGRYRISR